MMAAADVEQSYEVTHNKYQIQHSLTDISMLHHHSSSLHNVVYLNFSITDCYIPHFVALIGCRYSLLHPEAFCYPPVDNTP